jgi:signal transduction histidine kinase
MTQRDVPPTRQGTRDATSMPSATLLEALERWQEDPSDDGRASVAAALDRIVDRTRAHEALEAATTAIAAELDVDRVLQLIVDRVRDLIGARYAALGTADPRGRIERFITSGMSPETRAAIGGVPHGRGLLGLIIREARTVRVTEISSHPQSSGFPANHPAMHSFLGVPVLVKGRSVGNLYLAEKVDGDFTEDDERLVEMFAVHAGIAIDNARLHDQVQRIAVVEERERIGKDLHDGIIQAIYGVGLSLEDVIELIETDGEQREAAARVDRAIDSLNLVIGDIRSYILRLRPALGGEEDPVEGLARLAEELGMHAVIDLEVDLDDGAALLRSQPPDRCSDLLFIAREALSNIARHSGATRATVVLGAENGDLVLSIEDNGRGFDPDRLPAPDAGGRHQGVRNMRDRATGMGGSLVLQPAVPQGTRIVVRVPVAPVAPHPHPIAVTGDS